nr:carbohydrate-binding domain-containing protein [Bradyrhizobium jicamae]
MGKPAATIVSQYFHGGGATPNLNVIGSAVGDVIDLGRGNDTITTGLGNDVIHGGAGNDVIVAGPATISPLTSTTVTLTGYGSVVNGVGAQVRVLVNGQVVSGTFEFKPATDPSGYQTFTVTFANPVTINSLDIELVNSASGRALHLKDISVNGVAVMPTDTTNASSPNSFDLYVRTIHLDATSHQDWFYGSGTDNDLIYGGAGNDTIDGGAGTDTAVYSGKASDYDISLSGNVVTITDKVTGRDGTDHLTNVEFLKFSDKTVSTSLLTSNATASDAASLQLSGLQADQTIRHADGSRDVYISGITGKAYASQHSVVDAFGHSMLIEQFRADGSLLLKQGVDTAGVRTVDQFDGAGHLSQETITQTDGSYAQANYASDGLTLTLETFRHADGSRDIFTFGISGKDYTSQHVLNDASGHSVLIEQFRADDSLFVRQTVDAAGTKTLDQFDAAGHLAQETVTKSDGSYVQSSYDADGDLTTQTVRHVDGSRTVDTFGITGQSYSARHDVLDSSGHRLATTFDNNDGSHTMSAGASGVTLTSTAGNDFMTSAGGDTFVFKQASGQDVINNFHVGEGAGHDTLQIDSSIVADIAQLNIHVVGHDTIIDLGHGASITLTGVVTPLTPHDLLIV